MRKRSITAAATDATDADGVSVSQTPAAGGAQNLTITGALAAGGVATFASGQFLTITAVGDETARTFTVTGTDADGTAITEAITGPNATIGSGAVYFKTITQIQIDADTDNGAVTCGVLKTNGGVSPTMEVKVGQFGVDWAESLFTDIGAGTYTVEMTAEELNDSHANGYSNSANWVAITDFSAKTANVAALLTISCHGLRVNVTSPTSGSYKATLIERSPDGVA